MKFTQFMCKLFSSNSRDAIHLCYKQPNVICISDPHRKLPRSTYPFSHWKAPKILSACSSYPHQPVLILPAYIIITPNLALRCSDPVTIILFFWLNLLITLPRGVVWLNYKQAGLRTGADLFDCHYQLNIVVLSLKYSYNSYALHHFSSQLISRFSSFIQT